jgi:hypothetical protein
MASPHAALKCGSTAVGKALYSLPERFVDEPAARRRVRQLLAALSAFGVGGREAL